MTTPSGQSRLAGEAARVVRRMAGARTFFIR